MGEVQVVSISFWLATARIPQWNMKLGVTAAGFKAGLSKIVTAATNESIDPARDRR